MEESINQEGYCLALEQTMFKWFAAHHVYCNPEGLFDESAGISLSLFFCCCRSVHMLRLCVRAVNILRLCRRPPRRLVVMRRRMSFWRVRSWSWRRAGPQRGSLAAGGLWLTAAWMQWWTDCAERGWGLSPLCGEMWARVVRYASVCFCIAEFRCTHGIHIPI